MGEFRLEVWYTGGLGAEYRTMRERAGIGLLLLTLAGQVGRAEPATGPGDYGYRHEEYHHKGLVDELEKKVGHSCCDRMGECRATYVDLAQKKVFLDGRWCALGHHTAIRKDVILPDSFALVCAGKSLSGPGNPCPAVYCIAISPGL